MKIKDLQKVICDGQTIRLTQMGTTLYTGESGECREFGDMTVSMIEPDHKDRKRLKIEVYKRNRYAR